MDIKKILLSAATVTGMLTAGTVAANADTVTVKAGDTVSELANEYNTTIDAIKQQNSLQDANVIVVGQKLEIGGTTSTTSTSTSTTSTASTSTSTTSAPAASTTSTPAVSTSNTSSAATSTPAVSSSSTTTAAASSNTATSTTSTSTSTSSSESAARAWIAARESGGSYTAKNGQYYGKYQLSASYLNGDYSAANQERVANSYVVSRYGSWQNAVQHWQTNGWY
ncbi:LysM peptidoglycan-binding domain-containing protein [Liquorilactobacillus mali]|uniref:Peptidoglycan binding protein n=1 Tax=Liquorilactobacillus mali KCTC 3596 = DSM 20444 TaxID=1046596 RepID=J1F485_9LACO|nr:LysM domain-containing protein [Liquorilactobacillus mali]EJF00573.1 Peptidoglycan binding protein, LysM domain protein [Liquorilactobacillus mali KCTC 3596 = DSM 20444]KRN10186.1 peptidoglycan binding protein [Liquorilactobacillus mali KCTC 3596 = DSM 20444]MDC7953058.1 LysM peptidoglycan-binding domain-containing protein [Liquorilactobacillus mali]QFQ74058.1 LysM peptidoglycan-binding domain-containing protein [Liquorilactobacillus mali]